VWETKLENLWKARFQCASQCNIKPLMRTRQETAGLCTVPSAGTKQWLSTLFGSTLHITSIACTQHIFPPDIQSFHCLINIQVFWGITTCWLVKIYRCTKTSITTQHPTKLCRFVEKYFKKYDFSGSSQDIRRLSDMCCKTESLTWASKLLQTTIWTDK
jgi:hypothetical protein